MHRPLRNRLSSPVIRSRRGFSKPGPSPVPSPSPAAQPTASGGSPCVSKPPTNTSAERLVAMVKDRDPESWGLSHLGHECPCQCQA